MTILQTIILAIVEGLTEFLPVSSSGHLALLQYFFGVDAEQVLPFAVLLHLSVVDDPRHRPALPCQTPGIHH